MAPPLAAQTGQQPAGLCCTYMDLDCSFAMSIYISQAFDMVGSSRACSPQSSRKPASFLFGPPLLSAHASKLSCLLGHYPTPPRLIAYSGISPYTWVWSMHNANLLWLGSRALTGQQIC
ncbi:hypothetical protein ACFX14_043952 [Malus domestica]